MNKIFFIFFAILCEFTFSQTISQKDQFTNEPVEYQKVTTWSNNQSISDANVDGVVYIKKGNDFYKRIYHGPINVKWFGARGDNTTNDTEAFRKALCFLKNSITPSQLKPNILFVPRGDYIVDEIVWDFDAFQMEGEGPLATIFKFTNKMKNSPAGIFPKNAMKDTRAEGFTFYTNIAISNIGCDPTTIGAGKSFIMIRNTYNFIIRNVFMYNESFEDNKYGIDIKDNSYTGIIENCEVPKINIEGTTPWTVTTISLSNLRTTFINLKNALGITFMNPVIQGNRQKKVQIDNCNTVTLMNGDIEDGGTYLFFSGKNDNIRSYGNNILALKGKYADGNIPEYSYFDDKGNIGIGDVNLDGNLGILHLKTNREGISSSIISEKFPVITIEGNRNGTLNQKYTYTNSFNGSKSWGTISDEFFNYSEKMKLTNNGNLLIGSPIDTGQKLQVKGSVKLETNTVLNNKSAISLPEGFIIININGTDVKIPYYKL